MMTYTISEDNIKFWGKTSTDYIYAQKDCFLGVSIRLRGFICCSKGIFMSDHVYWKQCVQPRLDAATDSKDYDDNHSINHCATFSDRDSQERNA